MHVLGRDLCGGLGISAEETFIRSSAPNAILAGDGTESRRFVARHPRGMIIQHMQDQATKARGAGLRADGPRKRDPCPTVEGQGRLKMIASDLFHPARYRADRISRIFMRKLQVHSQAEAVSKGV